MADAIGEPFRARQWSVDFVNGRPTGAPATDPPVWIAPVLAGGKPVGTVTVARQAGKAVPAALDSDVELAAALLTLKPGVSLVEDPTIAGWFAIQGNTVRALNSRARVELPSATTVSDYQKVLAKRVAAGRQASKDIEIPVGGSAPTTDSPASAYWPYAFGSLAILAIGLLAGRAMRPRSALHR